MDLAISRAVMLEVNIICNMTLKVGLKYVIANYKCISGHGSIIYSKEPPLPNC
jgi:hypothetical protein